jgi:excisionase family DNA binding protein
MTKLAYTIPQAIDASGISRSTLYTYIKAKQLPVVKIGHRTLIRSMDLSEFINQRLVA